MLPWVSILKPTLEGLGNGEEAADVASIMVENEGNTGFDIREGIKVGQRPVIDLRFALRWPMGMEFAVGFLVP